MKPFPKVILTKITNEVYIVATGTKVSESFAYLRHSVRGAPERADEETGVMQVSIYKVQEAVRRKEKGIMKKKVVAGMLAVLMTASLAACGGKSTTSSTKSSDKKSSGEEITLTVWGPQEDQSDDCKWLSEECDAFAKAHPEWNLKFKYGVCSEGDAGKNVTEDATKAADVYMFANDQIPTLVSANAISKLGGDTVKTIKAENSESVVNSVTYNGDIYGVPFTGNTWFMYYNKSVFSEDDVKSLDTMLTKGKVAFPISNGWYLGSLYAANGCTFFGEDGQNEDAGIDLSGDKATQVTNADRKSVV